MKLGTKWTSIAVIPETGNDPTAVLGIHDGKLYITYDVDAEPPETWVWVPVSGKVED